MDSLTGSWPVMATIILSFLTGTASAGSAGLPDGFDSYQQRRLLAPTVPEQKREAKGSIYIYDRMKRATVNQAMDEEFDRIQNMMFTRIRSLPPTGAGPAVDEDDNGCD